MVCTKCNNDRCVVRHATGNAILLECPMYLKHHWLQANVFQPTLMPLEHDGHHHPLCKKKKTRRRREKKRTSQCCYCHLCVCVCRSCRGCRSISCRSCRSITYLRILISPLTFVSTIAWYSFILISPSSSLISSRSNKFNLIRRNSLLFFLNMSLFCFNMTTNGVGSVRTWRTKRPKNKCKNMSATVLVKQITTFSSHHRERNNNHSIPCTRMLPVLTIV